MSKSLTELHAKWVDVPGWTNDKAFNPFHIGVSFNCPCEKCIPKTCPTCGHTTEGKRLAVMFWPPIDPNNAAGKCTFNDEYLRDKHKRVSGETLDDLSVLPSVGFEGIGHWHGMITNGVLTP